MRKQKGNTKNWRKGRTKDVIITGPNSFYYFTANGNTVSVNRKTGARTLAMGSGRTYRERKLAPMSQKDIRKRLKD